MSESDQITRIDFKGQPALRLATRAGATAIVSLYGAQVLSWVPPRDTERLYLSESARFDGTGPIRGGVPVCWPQFAAQGRLPKHGLVRTAQWTVGNQRAADGYALASLRVCEDDRLWALWPHAFALELTVLIEENRLSIELEVENTGHGAFVFTGALHSYLRVREVEEARLEGLNGLDYRDSTAGGALQRERGEHLEVCAEIDRIYHKVGRPLLLREPQRSLGIHAEGFPEVVVWNPWEKKCAELPDMATLDFRRMLCVEAAVTRPVELAAGESWCGRQTLVTL